MLCLLRPKGVEQVSTHVATDTAVCFRTVEDPAYSIALHGQDPLDAQFEELAALFRPILDAMK